MATDIIARGIAVSNSGGGGGSTSVDIQDGVGIEFTGSDPIIINNGGITNVQTGNDSDDNGTIRVTYGKDSKTKSVPVKGLDNAAYKNVDTVINESTKDSENLPTTKAVKEVLDSKIDSSKLGEANGIATLDEHKKLVSDQLPSHNHGSNEVNVMTNYQKPSTLTEKEIKETDSLNTAIGKLEKAIDDKMDDGNYAGSSTKGGSATSAEKLSNTEQIGTNKKPVYFSADGVPVAIDHKLEKDVPSTAKFTDTTYSSGTGVRIDSTDNNKIYNMGVLSVSESATNGSIDFTIGKNGTETSETKSVPIHGLGDAAYKGIDKAFGVPTLDATTKISVTQIPTTDTYNVDSAYPVTNKAVQAAINTLPNPMVFKGSLGTGGTITSLPNATSGNEGFTYKVITNGEYAGQTAKVGDLFISDGSSWVYIPSADEPNGTVTSVGISVPTGLKVADGTSPVTTSGTIEILLDEGYVIPKSADIVPSTRKINNITLESDVVLDGDDIKATGYAKAESKSDIVGTDTINQAVGKLEYKVDTNETNISTLKKHVTGELTDSDFQEDTTAVMTKTVPTGMSNYAAISKISGKTQKVVQLISDKKTWTNGSTVDSKVFFMPIIQSRASTVTTVVTESLDSSSTSATGLYQRKFKATQNAGAVYIKHNGTTKDILIANNEANIVANHSYIFSCNIVANNPSANNGLSLTNVMLFDITAMGFAESTTLEQFNAAIKEYVPYGSYLWNVPVESVVSTSADGTNETTLLIPDSIKNLPDYGVEGNYVDFENGTYTHTNTITDGEVTALSTVETIDISDMLLPIRCESGGTITLQNEHNLDMPNTVVYKKEVSLS